MLRAARSPLRTRTAERASPAERSRRPHESRTVDVDGNGLTHPRSRPRHEVECFGRRKPEPRALEFVARANDVLGCIQVEDELLPADIEALIERRQAARVVTDFKELVGFRGELPRRGIVLEGTLTGVVWRKK